MAPRADDSYCYLSNSLIIDDFPVFVSQGDNPLQDVDMEMLNEDKEGISVIILDIVNNPRGAIKLLENLVHGDITAKFRIILISTLLTWTGDDHINQIGSIEDVLRSRTPLDCYTESLQIENSYLALSTDSVDITIIGQGIVYGNEGYDLRCIIESIQERCVIPVPHPGDRRFPCIHIDDLCSLIKHLILNPTTSHYIPAMDSSIDSLCTQLLNLGNVFATKTIRFSTGIEETLDFALYHAFVSSMLMADLHFVSTAIETFDLPWKYKSGLSRSSAAEVAAEYKTKNGLMTCSLVVVGMPSVGKTTLAKALAERLHLQYVDALSAVRCVAIAAAEDVQGEASPSQLVATVLRNDILASIKGGAGLDLKTLHSAISEGTLKTLAADLVRRCVSYTVTFDRLCVTHGFLLDLWSQQQNSIFGNSSDLRTVLSPLTYNPATKTVEGRSDASSVAVALILELQTAESASSLSKRFLKAAGHAETVPNKVPKDIAAQAKALDAAVTAYSSKMSLLEEAPVLRDDDVVLEASLSHEHVKAIEVDHSTKVVRVLVDGLELSALVEGIVHGLVKVRGPIGWVKDTFAMVPKPVSRISTRPPTRTLTAPRDAVFSDELEAVEPASTVDSLRIEDLDPALQNKLLASTDKLMESLVDMVLPQLAEAYLRVSSENPTDPIQFIADFLYAKGTEIEANAREAAKVAFDKALEAANAKEQQVLAARRTVSILPLE